MRQLASVTHAADHVDRMLLLSDGVTNAGIRDVPGLRAMAGRMHGRGVTISTVGVDVDFDEKVMAAIAREANGRHHFVANASGLPAVFAEEFDEVLASTARGADLVLELAPGVEVAEVFDRSFHREGNRVIVPFGTFSARQEKTVLVRLRVPTALPGQVPVADVRLSYRDLVKRSDGACRGTLALDVREGGSEQKDLDPFVAARLERSRTAQTLTEASSLFEQGRVSEARTRLAQRRGDLAATQQLALALANVDAAQPGARPGRSLERDFGDQIGAVELADRNFAAAPPPPVAEDRVAAGRTEPTGASAASGAEGKGGFAPAPASREGRAQVKVNQQAATEFGF
jgi:Ca-activated chloride channel family protein